MKTDNSWAYALQPGDKAAIHEGHPYGSPYVLVEFSRATATQFIFNEGKHNEKRVNKADMRVRGSTLGKRVQPADAHVMESIRRHELAREIAAWKADDLQKLSSHYLGIIIDTYRAGHPEIAE